MSQTTTDSEPTNDELLAMLRQRGLLDTAAVVPPTVKAFADRWLRTLPSKRSRQTYKTHIKRFAKGVGPVCDSRCEPCMVAPDFTCTCECRGCQDSRLLLEPQGDHPVSNVSLSGEHAQCLVRIARRIAKKRGVVDNRTRAAKGLSPKPASGSGAEETCRQALRSLYAAAAKWLDGENGTIEIRKPRRPTNDRRALADYELIELYQVTIGGGDDPELDELLFDYGIETGSRREGTYALTVGQIRRHEQLIMLCDKYTIPKPAPVSAELIERLLAHAIERGGATCDPTSSSYLPDSPVFHYRQGTDGNPHPLSDRRFDTLHERWQTELPWGKEIRVSFHFLRHTMSEKLKRDYGQHYAKRYLRHAAENVTDNYGECTLEQLSRAMGEIFGFEHPLAVGRERERREVFERYGLGEER